MLRYVLPRAFVLVLALAAAPAIARAQAPVTEAVPQSRETMRQTFAPIVREVAPAVVNVYADRVVAQRPTSPFFDDPFFRRFFGDQPGQERVQQALGSGVIIDAGGTVITNFHVIEEADEVHVTLSDRREYQADILLKDEQTDLAVLKIRDPVGPLPFLTLADSDLLQVGDLVLAIGNPFGVGQTVTSGIVSAVARTNIGISDYQFFIQTDAAINPGNSGGALVDVDGRLVGINTAIFSRTGGSIGIGFAIPANMVRIIAATAATGEPIRRPWLGAEFEPVTGEIASAVGLDRPRGALVASTFANGPAEAMGLRPGDVVTAVDGIEIDDATAINYRLATKGIGADATFSVWRDRREFDYTVTLAAAPEIPPRDPVELTGRSPFAGATVLNLSPAVAEELRYGGKPVGVIVSEIDNNSPAARVGFEAGDVILTINGEQIDDTAELDAISRRGLPVWRITLDRGGRVLQTTLGG
jgi:Do/DeqQ family serine protease